MKTYVWIWLTLSYSGALVKISHDAVNGVRLTKIIKSELGLTQDKTTKGDPSSQLVLVHLLKKRV